jgi:hypothetical protein
MYPPYSMIGPKMVNIGCMAMGIREDVASMITGDIANSWPDLCKSCTPTVISECQSGKFLDVEFTITNLG